MSVTMIMSTDRLTQEYGMLNRLAIGLMNDGEQVTRVIPPFQNDTPPEYENVVSIIPRLFSPIPIPWLQRKEKLGVLLEAITKAKTTSIVSFGKSSYSLSCLLANQLEIPIFQEIFSMQQAKRVKRNSVVKRWLAATPSIEQTIIERVGEARCELVPLGIATMPELEETSHLKTRCIVALNASDEVKKTRSILHACNTIPNTHVFLECHDPQDHKVWSSIKETDMHDRVTCLRDVAPLRKLIPQADLVVLPSTIMPVRTVLLEAMSNGVPVISRKIPGFDMLVDGETAILVDQAWGEPIKSLLEDSDLSARLGENAKKLIEANYGSTTQIAALQAAITPN